MDCIIKGLSLAKEIRFTFADVTESAEILRQRHGLGPAAARVLGEALAACALLSADSEAKGESVQMQLHCDGPVEGFQVEVTGTGDVRGYTRSKRLELLDDQDEPTSEAIMGKSGALNVIVSTPGNVLYSGQVQAKPADVRSAVARYYNQSLQIASGVEVVCTLEQGAVTRATAMVAQKMPSGNTEAFVQVLEAFHEGRVRDLLKNRAEGTSLWAVFGLEDLETTDSRNLQFGCRCSTQAVIASLASLDTEEIQDILDTTGTQEVTCHMCGEEYVVPEDVFLHILIERGRNQEPS
jgi:molecular chaperone Hsp33